MFTRVIRIGGRQRDQAEKPFWISYADLMTALSVLFLVAMSVALLAVTRKISDQELRKLVHDHEVEQLLDRVAAVTAKYPGVTLDRDRRVIDFGERALFGKDIYQLDERQAELLRSFVPEVLAIANTNLGRDVLKRVVVEGFASKSGTYLHNLNLSLERSQSVLCALFARPSSGEIALTADQLSQIRGLFVVGGYSFNDVRKTAAQSQRVELRLQLYALDESRVNSPIAPTDDFGTCELR